MRRGILRLLLRELVLLENPDAEQNGAKRDDDDAGVIDGKIKERTNSAIFSFEFLILNPASGTGSWPHSAHG